MTNGRKLRSKDDLKKDTDKALFNFENINKLIYRNQKIKVTHKTSYNNLYKYFGDKETTVPDRINRSNNIEFHEELPHRKSKQKIDMLDDSTYELFHRKMKKEERSMANIDRSRILSEVDNLNSLIQNLNQYDWVRHLPNITHVNNIRDYDELESKKNITIEEIERILIKFDNWKKRQDKLASDIREYDNNRLHYINNEDEFLLPIEYLREKNLKERRKEIGPTIKLNLRNGYVLVIEPFANPRIDKLQDNFQTSKIPHEDDSSQQPKSINKLSYRRNNRDNTFSEFNDLNFHFDENNNVAFGVQIPNIRQVSFTLNSYWRLHAEEWKNGREQFRRKLRKMNN